MNFKDAIKQTTENNSLLNKELIKPINNQNDEIIEDFLESSLDDYEVFEQNSWNKGDGYQATKFKRFTDYLEGLDEGLYLFAGESNAGKSAIMMNIMYDLCLTKSNKLFGIYYSLDDTKFEIIPRIISMSQSIPIGVCAKPKRYQNLIDQGDENSILYAEYLEKRQIGLDDLKANKNNFKIEDSSKIKSAEDMFNHMKQLQHYVKSIDPEMNIIVAIDAVDDIRFATKHFGSTTDRHAEIARTIKQWAVDLHIPIFGSRHLTKLKQNRRPVLDDLKDSNEYVYEASAVFLVHNDVSKNKQAANIFYQVEGLPTKYPVLELDWAKNKKSSFKGRDYYYFIPEYSLATECNENDVKRFDTIIYSN